MNKNLMVIAYGPNEVAIPCLFSDNKEQLKEILNTSFPSGKWTNDRMDIDIWDKNNQWQNIFKFYHNGNADIFSFEIVEVITGQPIVGFDLD